MKLSSSPLSILGRSLALAVAVVFGMHSIESRAAVTAGGLAVIGFTDNADSLPDSFTIVALEEITANTIVYFTDNGWNQFDVEFSGVNNSPGAGNESLLKLTFTSSVAAGTIMRSGVSVSGSFTWDDSNTTVIPGQISDKFNSLNLSSFSDSNGLTGRGDQIYIFQATESLPLVNVTNAIYLLDTGDTEAAAFVSHPASRLNGDILPDLSLFPNTAWILPDIIGVDDNNDFHNGSFALDLNNQDVLNFQATGATKEDWLAVIADPNNWHRSNFHLTNNPDPDLEAALLLSAPFNVIGVPEPSRVFFIGLALAGSVLRRRRY